MGLKFFLKAQASRPGAARMCWSIKAFEKMQIRPESLIGLLAIVVALCSPFAAQAARFTIQTDGALGFKEGNVTYKLRDMEPDALRRFAFAEEVSVDDLAAFRKIQKNLTATEYETGYLSNTRSHRYLNDGFTLTFKRTGSLHVATFYLQASQGHRAADVVTDTGVRAGASLGDIVKIYGEPTERREHPFRGPKQLEMIYLRGNDTLSFTFLDGRLNAISLAADYLPWMKKKRVF